MKTKEIILTAAFQTWLASVKDQMAVRQIRNRLARMAAGNLGDSQPVGQGVSECRIHYGPGYRLYYVQNGRKIIILLCGGTKKTQKSDIRHAIAMTEE